MEGNSLLKLVVYSSLMRIADSACGGQGVVYPTIRLIRDYLEFPQRFYSQPEVKVRCSLLKLLT